MKLKFRAAWFSANTQMNLLVSGDPDTNYSTFSDLDKLACHILVYYVRGLCSDLKFAFAYFATHGVTSFQIMTTFWKAIQILEITCKLPVITVVSDGASPNRKFYSLHAPLDELNIKVVTYRTINLFELKRYIWFFADAPHLLKTARNCIYHSSNANCTRYMWKERNFILRYHLRKILDDELESGLKLNAKPTINHIQLFSFSYMNVKLAAQALSSANANILSNYYGPETTQTALYCKHMNNLFDCLNVKSTKKGDYSRNELLKPYTTENGSRSDWLQNRLLPYFNNWKHNILQRPGNFTASAREKIFISRQTHDGIKIRCYSVIEATKYLLKDRFQFVLAETFCQDVLEEYFGRQRGIGRRNDDPTVFQFGCSHDIICMERSVINFIGNTRDK